MKKSCEYLREHAMKIFNFKKKKMIPLTKEQQELPEKKKVCYICKKSLNVNTPRLKIMVKLKITAIIKVNTEVQIM